MSYKKPTEYERLDMLRISNIKIPLSTPQSALRDILCQTLETDVECLNWKLVKKAIDARSRTNVHFICTVDAEFADEPAVLRQTSWPYVEEQKIEAPLTVSRLDAVKERPVVVGSGPAGMFAALILAEAGLRPIILERGKPVPERQNDVNLFWKTGKLNPDSNVQFGEGGAGTFSDGKLMTGIKKDVHTAKVFAELVSAGAPDEILYLAKPHLGTDRLALIVQQIRRKIVSLGGEYRFENCLVDINLRDEKIYSLSIRNAIGDVYELPTSAVLLAVGHSSRDTFEMLYRRHVPMEAKAFSVGARIEHPQILIDRALYHDFAGHPALGAADYKLSVHLPNGRSAYTFCMCPGGVVVAAASEPEHLVTNGMSYYARNKTNANSALLVGVTPRDFGGEHPLQGMYFQRRLENAAFAAGGRSYRAPAQLVGAFLKQSRSRTFADVMPSYSRGVEWGSLDDVFPAFITDTLRMAIVEMDKKLHGFAMPGAVLTGVETRSSSPVRLPRDENFESPVKGLYPCGEGAGYAGGIVSAAADGLKAALAVVSSFQK